MPRPPDQPVVEEDQEENRRRDEVTVGELYQQAVAEGETDFSFPTEPIDLDAVIQRIGPERWERLRRRRDEILTWLREHREEGDL
jgi:hypothetical protein